MKSSPFTKSKNLAFGLDQKPRLACRWLHTVRMINCVIVQSTTQWMIDYRRIQVAHQQSERQKKNLLQQILIFKKRSMELQVQDQVGKPWLENQIDPVLTCADLNVAIIQFIAWQLFAGQRTECKGGLYPSRYWLQRIWGCSPLGTVEDWKSWSALWIPGSAGNKSIKVVRHLNPNDVTRPKNDY